MVVFFGGNNEHNEETAETQSHNYSQEHQGNRGQDSVVEAEGSENRGPSR